MRQLGYIIIWRTSYVSSTGLGVDLQIFRSFSWGKLSTQDGKVTEGWHIWHAGERSGTYHGWGYPGDRDVEFPQRGQPHSGLT